ncbi:MAG: hypothetical protein P4L51_02895 [Puia sp.]|nr:hypothetical protein [Puia sp.]
MKKIFSLVLLSLGLFSQGRAQFSALGPVSSDPAAGSQMKSGIQSQMAYTPGAGNILTASITNQVATPLSLTADQKKSMNDALYQFFTAKGAFLPLRATDSVSYQQQQSVLLAGLIKTLGGFLSVGQVTRFVALKPAAGTRSSLLTIVFY